MKDNKQDKNKNPQMQIEEMINTILINNQIDAKSQGFQLGELRFEIGLNKSGYVTHPSSDEYRKPEISVTIRYNRNRKI